MRKASVGRPVLCLLACLASSASAQDKSLDDLERRLKEAQRGEAAKEAAQEQRRRDAARAREEQLERERAEVERERAETERLTAERAAAEAAERERLHQEELRKTGGCSIDHFRYAAVRGTLHCSTHQSPIAYERTGPGTAVMRLGETTINYFCQDGRLYAQVPALSGLLGQPYPVVEKQIGAVASAQWGLTQRLAGRQTKQLAGRSVEVVGIEFRMQVGSVSDSGTTDVLVGTPDVPLRKQTTVGSCELTNLQITEH